MLLDLPGYTLTSRAYEGAETILYRGRRDVDSVAVAVKVTRNEYPTSRELARLRREFAILTDLGDLPGVVRALALEKCGRGVGLVMEDLGPSSLNAIQKARRLDVEATLTIAVALTGTLDSLHRRDVIHKDIKPHNIMIDEATRAPRLVDFGISARIAQETPNAASAASLEGTLAYMSPEQTGRMNRAVDLRSDLYSLGVTLFEMLTGTLPFLSTSPTELIHSHIARAPTPPHKLAKEVPPALSDVVMKLLAKTPEERYQSARGLKADLERCLSEWRAARRIEPFVPGQKDRSHELRIPQKLYGREQDIAALLSAFERARKGATELMIIAGHAGIGKSALVNELHKPIAHRGGAFVQGKFDPDNRDAALAPVARAIRELVRQIVAEPAAVLDRWRSALLKAIGQNGRLLFDLIPELEIVVGHQPDVPALGPSEARNRFELLVQRLVRVFATAEHPLALFLDDLQWADPTSLRLLDLLLRNPDSKYLLVLGAYRDSEVDAAHPLVSTLDELRKGGVTITELTLRPLDPPTVTELVAETLGQSGHEVEELSALVFDKTQGNPFFLSQFMGALLKARLVWFDAASSAFTWDLGRIRGAMVTDNVVDLMLAKLHRLAQPTQHALRLAACIGHRFDLGTLSIIYRKSPAETACDLWEALREGLVVPLDGDYRLVDVSGGAASGSEAIDFEIAYGFLHDRVRDAAYALIPGDQKEEVHLTIGRLLWARSGQPARDADLLEIVRHLHLGARGLAGDDERRSVAELDLRAGRRAKAATAYQAAFDSFTAGIELLGPQGWERDYALCFSLHNEGAECAYLSGAIERAEALFDVILPRASSSLERARIYNLRMILYTTLGKHSEAIKAGLAGLERLGVTLPATLEEQQAAFARGPAEVTAARGGRRIEDLVHAPRIEDPRLQAALQLLSDMLMSSFYVTPLLHPTIVARIVTISLEHGHSDMSAFGYVTHGLVLALVMNQPAEGHAYGKLAFALNEKFQNAVLTARLNVSFASYLYLCEPLWASIPYYQAGRRAALECGDFVYLSTNCLYQPLIELGAGCPLDEIREQVERFLVLMQRTRDLMATSALTVVRQTIANLQGKTRSRTSLSDDRFDEDRFLAELEGREQPIQFFYYYAAKLQIHLLHGDTEAALAAAEKGEAVSAAAALAHPLTRFRFHVCLLLLSLPPAEAEVEERRRATIADHRDKLAAFAALCPQNFEHQIVLIDAEAARRSGKHAEAMDLYDQAIDLAKENEFPQDEALANELCAKMYVAIGRAKAARSYMADAYLGYRHWGALAKAEGIATEHRPLLSALTTGRGRRTTTSDSSTSAAMTTLMGQSLAGNLRDAALVVRAAQAIAGEIMLPRVIERLSKIVLESAGAERGALLLERDGELFVEATFGVDPDVLDVGPSTALDGRSDIAQSVALFVARTREPVVFSDAGPDRRFAVDPYITAHGVKSLLCLPLMHQGRLSGLLYLENKNVPATFSAARVELLELFSSQAAIAIEHARMVADVHAANDNVHRANTRLEAEVAERTEELRLSNEELGAANQRLQVELVQREQAEQERAELQEKMIQTQRARLSEMSTPLIPITDTIMVMPLIGTVDAERAAQVLEVALDGAARHRARVVILDVTGIRLIDTHVIKTLLDATSSLRLLGTQAVLTGITPEVAQTMVRLGTDLGAILTKGSLQRGIAYALQLAGERPDARKLG